MLKKFFSKRIVAMLTVLSMIFALGIPTPAFAAEASTDTVSNEATVRGDTLPPKVAIASQGFSNISGSNNTLKINIPAGKTARHIYVIGNQNGGGADTTMYFVGTGISAFGKTVDLDGEYHKISAYGWSQTGGTLVLNVDINGSGNYNLAFLIYD